MREMRQLLGMFLLTLTLCLSCTDAELCYQPNHPHRADAKFSFDWGSYQEIPHSMMVICNRVVNLWKAAAVVNSQTNIGHFIFNAPRVPAEETPAPPTEGEETDTPTEGEETDTPTEGGETDTPTEGEETDTPSTSAAISSPESDRFSLPVGTYKFLTISCDTTELDYTNVYKFLNDNTGMVLQDVDVSYKTYGIRDKGYRGFRPGWEDNNNYGARYMQPDVYPLFYDTIAPRDLNLGETMRCHFTPKALTQNIDVYLTIKKKSEKNPFTIDSVQAELAGIPISLNLSTGYLDITKTAKLPFRMDRYVDGQKLEVVKDSEGKIVSSGDTHESTEIECHGNIDCTGIVYNADPEALSGPGIMQLAIYLTIEKKIPIYQRDQNGDLVLDDNGQLIIIGYNTMRSAKMIQGKINLFHTLREADLLEYLAGGRYVKKKVDHAVLRINADVELNADNISEESNEGMDSWVSSGSKDIIIDI